MVLLNAAKLAALSSEVSMANASIESRFWEKVDIKTLNECWDWTAALNAYGYGWFNVKGKAATAHRVAAWLGNKLESLSSDKHVLHACDNRKCCNPGHLFIGTNADNVQDRVTKNRSGSCPQRGMANGMAKLSDKQVGEIRGMYFASCMSQSQLAKKYNVQQPQISRIINSKRREVYFDGK
jgi:hypothetical protein